MPSSDPVIVLAAGRGTRMGGPKAFMDAHGEPWWKWQCRSLAGVTSRQVWVGSSNERRAFSDPPAPIELVESDDAAPMFVSLLAGLKHLMRPPTDAEPPIGTGVYVLPVDVPAAPSQVWRALADAQTPSIPTYNGRGGHPVHLPWKWIASRIDLSTPDPGGRLDLLLRDGARSVPVDDDSVCRNLNRPEDLDAWLSRETRS